jgi:phage repressor protein C with HTH and peptisase S24 domain
MGNGLRTLREARGWTHEIAAERMGVSRSHFIKLERGERALKERTIALAAKAFEVAPADVLRAGPPDEHHLESSQIATAPALEPQPPATAENYAPPPEFLGPRDLKVYAAVEGGPGEMVVNTDPIETVQRPWYLGNVREGYAVLVVGDSMEPVFEAGDMAIVNPRLAPLRGTDVILVAHEEHGQFTATIKRLVSWNQKEWQLRQYNPRRDFTLSRREWPKALRVVGKYSGR